MKFLSYLIKIFIFNRRGLGQLYVRRFDKSSNYIHTLCKKKNFPLDTPLKLYEVSKFKYYRIMYHLIMMNLFNILYIIIGNQTKYD